MSGQVVMPHVEPNAASEPHAGHAEPNAVESEWQTLSTDASFDGAAQPVHQLGVIHLAGVLCL